MGEAEDLVEAARANDIQRVASIVARNPQIVTSRNTAGTAALAAAIAASNRDVVEYLLRKETKLDVFTAAALGRGTDVSSMLASNRDLAWRFSDDGFTALHVAAQHGHAEVAALLIRGISEIGAKARDAAKSTPLHLAAMNGHTRVAQQLLAAGADINGKDAQGKTPVGIAMAAGQAPMVAFLQEQGGVEELIAAAPRAATPGAAASAALPAIESVNPATGKPSKATDRALEAINRSREKRGLPPLPGAAAAAAAPAAGEGTPATAIPSGGNQGIPQFMRRIAGKPTVAVERAERAIWGSRVKRGLVSPIVESGAAPPAAASAAAAPVTAAASANDGVPQFMRRIAGKPTTAVERAERAIWRARQKRGG